MADPIDPVRATRYKAARWAKRAKRAGMLIYLLSIVLFVIGFGAGFEPAMVTVIVICLAIGSLLLLPATIVGYGVNAAEREDRATGR